MTQLFDDFKKQYPKVAEAMGILGMTHAEYREAYDRAIIQGLICLPVDTSSFTTPLPPAWQRRYSNSTVATKE
jgi:hypothetical protein